MSKLLPVIAITAPLFATGCNGALWGNIAVLGITVGIFYGTLSLGRAQDAARSTADGASSTAGRS